MTSAVNALSAMMIDPHSEPVFMNGDVAVIMRADGTTRAVATGLNAERLLTVDMGDWTEEDHLANSQGRKLLAVALAVQNPQLLDIMHAVIDDPTVLEALLATRTMN